MLEWWSSVFFYIVLLIAAIALWSLRHFRLNRQVVISVVFALVAFLVLFFLQGEAKFPNASAPIANKVWGTIAIILAFYSVLQALEWTMIEFLDHRYKLKLPHFLIDFLRWLVLIILSLALIRELFGLELTGLVITSTVATAIIGLSLQEIMSNLFAGITLQIESPFTIGDWLSVKGVEGKVAGQSWRSLSIITRMNDYVIFTNNSISKEQIINYARPTALQGQELFISVSHDYSPTRVKKVLLNTIMGVEAVQKTPAPKAYLVEYGEYHIKYRVKYWIRDYVARLDIQDAIMTHFWFALRRAKIALPVPVREVNMRAVAADDEEQKQSTLKNKIIEMLSSLPFLEELNHKQLEVLAEAAILQRYTVDEALVRQGEEGDSLFIIKSGEVTIYVHNGEQPIYVAERGVGDFFGEMSLLTGESRSASVIAKTETEVVTIDKEAFANVLTTDRMILDLMLDALEKRRSVLLEKLARNVKEPQQQELSKRQLILNRITHFLGLK